MATAAAWVALLAERGEPAQIGRKELGTLSREAGARIVFGAAALFLWGDGRPHASTPPVPTPDVTPILLVPGQPQTRAAMMALAWFLRHRGHRWVWAVSPGRGGVAERAQHVEACARALMHRSGHNQIHIVAHGLGGLAAAWYVRHLDPQRASRKLVTLGTPWRGTRMAVFTSGPMGKESLPGAPILDGLVPCSIPTYCIWGSMDPMVLPHTSAVVEGAVSVEIEGAGHLDLLLSGRAFRAVERALTPPAEADA